jgi:hypothetical protein
LINFPRVFMIIWIFRAKIKENICNSSNDIISRTFVIEEVGQDEVFTNFPTISYYNEAAVILHSLLEWPKYYKNDSWGTLNEVALTKLFYAVKTAMFILVYMAALALLKH